MFITRLLALALLAGLTLPAQAYDRDRFYYCRDRAAQVSGYNGPVPDRWLPGGAGRGAVGGAATGAVLGAITGGSGRDVRRAAGVGLVAGALVGAARRERARDQQRDRRYVYELELDRCMNRYR